ncbi:hypothetical protein N602_01275 [Mycobacterium avium subsp. hominissuis 10-5606]|nr:hypothetical protein N602_01275 [Mycobacterium avium subsp. hominissuis 10-5606]
MAVAAQHLRAAHADLAVTGGRRRVRDELDLGDAGPAVGVGGVVGLLRPGAPTVATGTSVQPYTRVTTARSK